MMDVILINIYNANLFQLKITSIVSLNKKEFMTFIYL